MKLLLIVPDGVAIRNYTYSGFISELQKNNIEVILYHQISDSALTEIGKMDYKFLEVRKIPYYFESPKARIVRESLVYARILCNMKKLNNPTIMAFWKKKPKRLKQKVLFFFSEIFGSLISRSEKSIAFFEDYLEKQTAKNSITAQIKEDFKSFQPDVVLNLHQRSSLSAPISYAAKINKVPSATVIFSWDNVPKARLVARFDYYFVWSDLMKNELTLLYNETKESQIKVVGTPQFEFYFDEKLYQSKSDFFAGYGLNPNKKTVCFSSNDPSSPYEQDYFDDVCSEISKMEESIRPQVIFRRNPVDISNRFDATLSRYKDFVVSIAPDWQFEEGFEKSFATIYPTLNDNRLLVNTVKHSDVVINLGSTMAHDFAVLNKPCLYLNYDPVKNSTFKVEDIYNFQHFRSLKKLNGVEWINAKSEIIEKISLALNHPNTIAVDRNKWMEIIVQHPLNESSTNLVNEIKKICTSV